MRRQTIGKVLRAMEDLKAESCRINIKNLMAYSGLSRSVFAKPHMRDLIQDQLAVKEQKQHSTGEWSEKSTRRNNSVYIKNGQTVRRKQTVEKGIQIIPRQDLPLVE